MGIDELTSTLALRPNELSMVEEDSAVAPRRILAYKSLRSTAASDNLDLIRGVAALAVLLAHFRQGFFPGLIPKNADLLTDAVYFATAYGHIAVIVFFVLSGFLVGGTVVRGWMDDNFSWSHYALNRLTRLWIVLIPALLLTAIWDHIGIHLFGISGIYGTLGKTHDAVLQKLSVSALLGNAFFLQGILAPVYGSNGPLWSLSYEFWYYLLFPLILLAIPVKKLSWSSALYGVAALTLMYFVGKDICAYFLIWLLGALINVVPEQPSKRAMFWIVAAIAGVVLIALLKSESDLIVGVSAAVVIFVLLRSPARSSSAFYSQTAHRLAGFSYTLYLVHAPPMVFASAWLVPPGSWQPNVPHVAAVVGLGVCVVAYTLLIAQFTESRTEVVRLRLTNALGLHGSRSQGVLISRRSGQRGRAR